MTDASNNPIGEITKTFNVTAAVADTQPPVATIAAPDLTSAGGHSETITVNYTDNVEVKTSSIGVGNLSVSGPGGPLTVTGATFTGGGKNVTALYTVAAPGNAWDASANGTYQIALNANQILDTSDNATPVTFGSFTVNIPIPNPTDTTFNSGNAVASSFVAEAVATQVNGKILVVGYQLTGTGQSQGVVQRLNADGSLDASFGSGGQVVTSPGSTQWFALTIQGANHFIVAGTSNSDFALARYDFNGNLDPTFGTHGMVVTDFVSNGDIAYSVALAPNGQIVAAGTSNNRLAVARYDANGNLDSLFAEGGLQIIDTGAATQTLGAVAVENDGRIVAAGSSGGNIEVIRLTSSGQLDSTFNSDGTVAVAGLTADQSSGAVYTVALALASDGKILVANRTASGHFGIARLTSAGNLDSAFGTGGVATANFGGADEANSIVVQDTGAILIVGTSLQNGQPLTAVAALDPAGKLISSFGEHGLATFSTGVGPTSRELHIGDLVLRAFGSSTTNGKLLVGTSSTGAQTVSSSLRRIIVPGTTRRREFRKFCWVFSAWSMESACA